MAEAKEILHARIGITQIIRKHVFDCYVQSWITEAEELEEMFGDELLARFLFRIQYMSEHGADMKLERAAGDYVSEIPIPDKRLRSVHLEDGDIRPRRPIDPIDFFVYRHFLRFIQQINDIKTAEITETEKRQLIYWRTGTHGESGLGYQLASLLRTESDTAQATASVDAYDEAGVDAYKYNAMMDDKTCNKCKALHGKIFLIEEKQPGENFPPIHRNCRCYTEPVRIGGTHGTYRHN